MKQLLSGIFLLPFLLLSQHLSTPVISHTSGFYTEAFSVTITHPDPEATILYTLDGSDPKIENLTGKIWNYKKTYPTNPGDAFGTLLQDTIWAYEYSMPVLLKDKSSEQDRIADISTSYYTNDWFNSRSKQDSVNVFKGIVLRVAAYKNGTYSKIITKNYFLSPEGVHRYSLPVVCLDVDSDKLYGYENGLNVPGIQFDQWRILNPTAIPNSLLPGNFRAEGSASEIEVHFSYFKDGIEQLNHNVGLRNHGNGSRYFPNRSVRLYAKSEYGASKFNFPFFANYNYDSFKRIILRNSGNDTRKTMFRDAFIQQAVKHLNFEIQEYQPAVVFINSEYNGLYNIRERFDDKFFERKYNIAVQDLDYLENNGEVGEGDDIHYFSMLHFLENNSLHDDENYRYIITQLDPVNFTDYYITEIFIDNIDWPHNNNEYWRKRVQYDSTAQYGHDGRWRWVIKDLDLSFGDSENNGVSNNSLSKLTTIGDDELFNNSTLIFRKLLENEAYKKYFINRFADLMNTTFLSERLRELINRLSSEIEPEIQEFIDRWNPANEYLLHHFPVYSYSAWQNHIQTMKDFAEDRPYFQRKYIREEFNLESDLFVLLNVSDSSQGFIRINTIDIIPQTIGVAPQPYPWTGTYFKHIPITMEAIAKPGYVFTHWSGEYEGSSALITLDLERDLYIKANFVTEEEYLNSNFNEYETKQEVVVYPNPFKDKINILADFYDGEYSIYSVDGKLVKRGVFNASLINLEDLSNGIFILEINTKKNVFTKQIIKY